MLRASLFARAFRRRLAVRREKSLDGRPEAFLKAARDAAERGRPVFDALAGRATAVDLDAARIRAGCSLPEGDPVASVKSGAAGGGRSGPRAC